MGFGFRVRVKVSDRTVWLCIKTINALVMAIQIRQIERNAFFAQVFSSARTINIPLSIRNIKLEAIQHGTMCRVIVTVALQRVIWMFGRVIVATSPTHMASLYVLGLRAIV